MFSRKAQRTRISTFAGSIAIAFAAWIPAASSGSPSAIEGKAVYAPIESIGYDFGSKSMSGYFVKQGASCLVTLMVFEKSVKERPVSPSAARVRLVLAPGQIAGLDGEEGRSLNFTCGEDATTLLAEAGPTDRLGALQASASRKTADE